MNSNNEKFYPKTAAYLNLQNSRNLIQYYSFWIRQNNYIAIVVGNKFIIPVYSVASYLRLDNKKKLELKVIKVNICQYNHNNNVIVGSLVLFNKQLGISINQIEDEEWGDREIQFMRSIFVVNRIYKDRDSNLAHTRARDKPGFMDASAYLIDDHPYSDCEISYFGNDYLVIDMDKFDNNLDRITDHLSTCELWGGFSLNKKSERYLSDFEDLKIIMPNESVLVPTELHRKNLQNSVEVNHVFYQYLSLYHQLELLFDLGKIVRVQQIIDDISYDRMDYDSLSAIYSKLATSKEIDILYNLTENMEISDSDQRKIASLICKQVSIPQLPQLLQSSTESERLRKFKQLRSEQKQEIIRCQAETNIFLQILIYNPISDSAPTAVQKKQWEKSTIEKIWQYKYLENNNQAIAIWDDLGKSIVYWVYRIRCSIVHNKFGQAILDANNIEHQKFVAEFGIPIIKLVLLKLFSDEKIRRLFSRE